MSDSHKHSSNLKRSSSIFSETAAFFTSVRTAITLLFLLAVASVLGTVIPQEAGLAELQHTMSPFALRLIAILDLNNLFSSWWFFLLLLLLNMNLLGCLVQRLPTIASSWRGSNVKKSFSKVFSDEREAGALKPLVVAAVGSKLATRHEETKVDKTLTLTWTRQKYHLLGFPLIHIGIVVVLLGGLLGQIYGYRGHILISEGESGKRFKLIPSNAAKELPFSIHVDKFTLTRYPTGEPKEYRSDVRLLDNSKELKKGGIKVNHPMTYSGISLYQSDYRALGVKSVELELKGPDGKSRTLVVNPRKQASIPDTDYKLKLLSLDPGTTTKGAGVEAAAESPKEGSRKLALFESDAKPAKLGPWELSFKGYERLYATGLQVGYDPGTNVVWFGCGLLIIGLFITLFTNHQRVTVAIEPKDGRSLLKVSGSSKRQRKEFREQVTEAIQQALTKDAGVSKTD